MLFIPCKSLYPCLKKKKHENARVVIQGNRVLTAMALFNPQFPSIGGLLENRGMGACFLSYHGDKI